MDAKDAMVIRADARAMGAITALGAPMRKQPRTRTLALSPCITSNPSQGIAPTLFVAPGREQRTRNTAARRNIDVDAQNLRDMRRIATETQATIKRLEAIGDQN